MAKYKLPVTWAVCGWVEVEAPSLGYAVNNFNPEDHSLPDESEFIDGSFELSTTNLADIKVMTPKSIFQTDTTKNHLHQKRDANGKFKKKDWIAEFEYPHLSRDSYTPEMTFRKVKVIKFTKDSIIGVQLNGKTGYKHFKKAKMLQEPVVYRTYLL